MTASGWLLLVCAYITVCYAAIVPTSYPNNTAFTEVRDTHITQEYIVVFKNYSCDHDAFARKIIKAWSSRLPLDMINKYRFGRFSAMRVKLVDNELDKLRRDPEVKYIEVNRKIALRQGACVSLSNGACVQQSTGAKLWGLSRLSVHENPDYGSAKYTYLSGDGSGVDAYVVDTGVFVDHEEFEGRAIMAFMSSDLTGQSLIDEHGHGTHVSGTIAGKTYGVAKKANIIGVKVLGKDGVGSLGGLLEGLQWVHQDYTAKRIQFGNTRKAVVNLSLGGAPGEIQSLDEAAITIISQAGLPFVVAAGNDNVDACLVSPARLAVAITVGAVDKTDTISTFSNSGPCVDILAPGEAILSSYIGSSSASAIMTGTSMATPHVTGVIARFLGQSCETTPTPAATKAWLQDISTQDVINLGTKLATPNNLLFMFCLAGMCTSMGLLIR